MGSNDGRSGGAIGKGGGWRDEGRHDGRWNQGGAGKGSIHGSYVPFAPAVPPQMSPPPFPPRPRYDNSRQKETNKRKRGKQKSKSPTSSSSTSSEVARDRCIRKAERLLVKHSPAHRQLFEEADRKEKEANSRAEGQVLAQCLRSTFEEVVKATQLAAGGAALQQNLQIVPQQASSSNAAFAGLPAAPFPPPTPAVQQPPLQIQGGTPSPSPPPLQIQGGTPSPAPTLSLAQRRWIEAEFGHKFRISTGQKEEAIAEIVAGLRAGGRSATEAFKKFVTRHGAGKPAPKAFADKGRMIWSIASSD